MANMVSGTVGIVRGWSPVLRGLWFAALLMLPGCGLLSPRPAEHPMDIPEDPIRLSSVLDGTGREFIRTEHEDILDPQCVYIHPHQPQEGAEQIRLRLGDIVETYPDIHVQWKSVREGYDFREGGGTVYRRYDVWLRSGDPTRPSDYRGEAVFKVHRGNTGQNSWTIIEWEDSPFDSSGAPLPPSKESFFHPDFEGGTGE